MYLQNSWQYRRKIILFPAEIINGAHRKLLKNYAVPENSSLRHNEMMKLSKKSSHINLDGIFGLLLLIYGRIMKQYVSKFMQDNLSNSMIVNLTTDFCNRFRKWNSNIETSLEFFMLLKRNLLQKCTVMTISCH